MVSSRGAMATDWRLIVWLLCSFECYSFNLNESRRKRVMATDCLTPVLLLCLSDFCAPMTHVVNINGVTFCLVFMGWIKKCNMKFINLWWSVFHHLNFKFLLIIIMIYRPQVILDSNPFDFWLYIITKNYKIISLTLINFY